MLQAPNSAETRPSTTPRALTSKIALARRAITGTARRCRYAWNRTVRGIRIDSPPVFIVGCGHSGTSLLLNVLGAHSRIHAIPFETRFALRPNPERALRKYDLHAVGAGKRRWVEKTPKHIHRIATLLELRPEAKIVLMVRDGRDVASSIKARTGSLEDGVSRWNQDNEAGRAFWSHPNLYLIRYEDIIGDFDAAIGALLEFLDEDYEPAMKEYHRTPSYFFANTIERPPDAFGENHHNLYRNWQVNQPLFDGRGRWKELTAEELRYVVEEEKQLLTDLGYSTDPPVGESAIPGPKGPEP